MRIAARLLVAAGLTLSFAVLVAPGPSRAEVDGSVAIGCELLFFMQNPVNGCDGLTAGEVQDLAERLGDEDDTLEASDFAGIDFDANQIYDGGQVPFDSILVFAFVDNDGVVTFDADFGVTVAVNKDGFAGGADDLNPETCESDDDRDCDTTMLDDGDGVVVAKITDVESVAGDDIGVDIWQEDDPSTLRSEMVFVVGVPDEVTILAYEPVVQRTTDVDECVDESNALDESQIADSDRTFVAATVTDSFGTHLARAEVNFSTSDTDIAQIGSDTFLSIDRGADGIAALAVVCGGEQQGVATVTAEITGGEDASVDIAVVGPPATIELQAAPASILCDGVETSTVTATVRDNLGSLVADGVPINFSVFTVGVVTPIKTLAVTGQASTSFRGVSSFTQGVPVIVTAGVGSGAAQASILLICNGFDTDGDGMPNAFEEAHPCLSAYAPDALADPDGDVLNNRAELLAGTNACEPDTDGDGCGDGAETLELSSAGGDRNPLDQWDFYDVTSDGAIDLADTVAILQKFGLGPAAPGYVAAYDRYAPNPQKLYRTAQATGGHLGIDIADAIVNLQSFGHSCV